MRTKIAVEVAPAAAEHLGREIDLVSKQQIWDCTKDTPPAGTGIKWRI